MAKQNSPSSSEPRQSRKNVLLNRKQQQQYQQIRLAVALVVGFLVLVLAVGLLIEFVILPPRPVATVNGEVISLRDWQARVRYERTWRIDRLKGAYDQLGGNVSQLQQFFSQDYQLLLSPASLGDVVLQQMISETLVRQAAVERSLTVADDEVQKTIEEQFDYYGGGLPPVTATPTETPVPTPSITPIPTAVITEVVPTSTPLPTPVLTPTVPPPTATPVSAEFFQEQYQTVVSRFESAGAGEDAYRSIVRTSLLRDKLLPVIAQEQSVGNEAEQVSLYYISFETEAEAQTAFAQVQASGYITTWNTIRSTPRITSTQPFARDLSWTTQDNIVSSFGQAFADAAFSLALNTPSDVIASELEGSPARYYLIEVRDRATRPLSENDLQTAQDQALSDWLDAQKIAGGVEIFTLWESRVPTRPILPTYLIRAQATPTLPVVLPTDTGQ